MWRIQQRKSAHQEMICRIILGLHIFPAWLHLVLAISLNWVRGRILRFIQVINCEVFDTHEPIIEDWEHENRSVMVCECCHKFLGEFCRNVRK